MTQDETVGAVLAIAGEVFGQEIQEGDDFFSLGGDSINAVELIGRLEELLGRPVELHSLWDSESMHEFAARVAHRPDRAQPA